MCPLEGSALYNAYLAACGAHFAPGALATAILEGTDIVDLPLQHIGVAVVAERSVVSAHSLEANGFIGFAPTCLGDGAVVHPRCVLLAGDSVADRGTLLRTSKLWKGSRVPRTVASQRPP